MMKECVVLNGDVINIGPWDYRYTDLDDGETVALNPLPEGAVMQELEIVEGADGGLYPADYTPTKTPEQTRLDLMQTAIDDLILGGAL